MSVKDFVTWEVGVLPAPDWAPLMVGWGEGRVTGVCLRL